METAYEAVKKKIDQNDLIILDGGVGTELQFRGIEMDETWCGSASLNTQVLEQIHLDYINAGAEVMKAFTGSCTLDMDFAGGDDIIDGADITSTGFCAAGSNGQTNTVVGSAASTYTQFITATDTIDCTIAGAAPATGRLRMYATVIDLAGHGLDDKPDEVDRDQLA